MNLQPYRQSFCVFVADTHVERGREIASQLTLAGYNCEQRVSAESLLEEIVKNPPHIIIFHYGDSNFFPHEKSYAEFIGKIQKILPEVHIIFFCSQEQVSAASELYEYEIYDVVVWPTTHPMQLLRAVDRAGEVDYYMYLNEQLQEKLGGQAVQPSENYALFELWLKEIDKATQQDELIQLFLKEAARVHQSSRALYLRFIESKKTLVAAAAVGLNYESITGVGLDLLAQEPGFQVDWLREPSRLHTLKEFTLKGLQADQAAFYPISYKNEILGVIIVPIPKQHAVHEDQLQNGYLLSCLHTLRRQMDILDIQSRLQKFSIYDEVSEALSAEIFIQKVREEVSRARRLTRPVTILLVALDGLVDLSLEQSKHNVQDLLRAVADLLRKNSRMNDMVGRVAPDQFALCLPHTDKRGGAIKAERIRRLVESSDFSALVGKEKVVTVSIGVSEYPANCHDAEALFQNAEGALIEIRKVGFNRVRVASPPTRFVPDFVVNDAKSPAPYNR